MICKTGFDIIGMGSGRESGRGRGKGWGKEGEVIKWEREREGEVMFSSLFIILAWRPVYSERWTIDL